MTEAEIDALAQTIWDYMCLRQTPVKSDVIFVPCSFDVRVAEHAARLYLEGLSSYIIFSGSGIGRITQHLFDKTEAETFADVAAAAGVPREAMLLEKAATNTGENIRFGIDLLQTHNIRPSSVLIVQKPYIERRVLASFQKQWPAPQPDMRITSPPIRYQNYFNDTNKRSFIIEAIVGDLQRLELYGKQGLIVTQNIPTEVWDAYLQLIALGYTARMIQPTS